MARKVLQVCDLHAGDVGADGVLVVQLAGERFQLDLCESHLAQVRRTLGPLLAAAHAARPSGRSRQVDGSRRARTAERAEVRAWAREHGYDVHDRGRVPAEVVAAYEAARAAGPGRAPAKATKRPAARRAS